MVNENLSMPDCLEAGCAGRLEELDDIYYVYVTATTVKLRGILP